MEKLGTNFLDIIDLLKNVGGIELLQNTTLSFLKWRFTHWIIFFKLDRYFAQNKVAHDQNLENYLTAFIRCRNPEKISKIKSFRKKKRIFKNLIASYFDDRIIRDVSGIFKPIAYKETAWNETMNDFKNYLKIGNMDDSWNNFSDIIVSIIFESFFVCQNVKDQHIINFLQQKHISANLNRLTIQNEEMIQKKEELSKETKEKLEKLIDKIEEIKLSNSKELNEQKLQELQDKLDTLIKFKTTENCNISILYSSILGNQQILDNISVEILNIKTNLINVTDRKISEILYHFQCLNEFRSLVENHLQITKENGNQNNLQNEFIKLNKINHSISGEIIIFRKKTLNILDEIIQSVKLIDYKQNKIIISQHISSEKENRMLEKLHVIEEILTKEKSSENDPQLFFDSFQDDVNKFDFSRINIFPAIEDFGNKIKKLHENNQEKAQELFISTLFDHYSNGSFKFPNYSNRESDFRKFFFPFHQSAKCFEINGIGGIGKTAFCDVLLNLYSLLGKDIIYIGSTEGYASGTGYAYGPQKFKKKRWVEISINKILETIDEIDQTNFSQNLCKSQLEEKMNYIFSRLNRGLGSILFLDNYISYEIEYLIRFGNGSLSNGKILYTSKKQLKLTPFQLTLVNFEHEKDRIELINIFLKFLNYPELNVTQEIKIKIAEISEGHPITTFLIASNLDTINLYNNRNFKESLDDFSNESAVQNYVKRVINNVLPEELYDLLVNLAQIEEEINIDIIYRAISSYSNSTVSNKKAKQLCNDLIKCFFLKKVKSHRGKRDLLVWQYNQIREAILDESPDKHLLAINYYRMKIEKYRNIEDEIALNYHLVKNGQIEGKSKKFKEFFNILENEIKFPQIFFKFGKELITKLKDKESIAGIYNDLGLAYHKKSDWDNAIRMYTESLRIFNEIRDKEEGDECIARIYIDLGLVYYKKTDWDKAIKVYKDSLKIFNKLGDEETVARIYIDLGLVYYKKGDLNRSGKFYEESLKLTRGNKNKRTKLRADAFNRLALIYYQRGTEKDLKKALKNFEKSISIKKELKDIQGITESNNGKALTFYKQGNFSDSIKLHKENLNDRIKFNNLRGCGQTCYNLGLVYEKKGDSQKSIKWYIRCKFYYKKIHSPIQEISAVDYRIGEHYLRQNNFEAAINQFEPVKKVMKRLGDWHRLANTLSLLGNAHYNNGDSNEYINCYKDLLDVYDKTRDDEIRNRSHGCKNAKKNLVNVLEMFEKIGDDKLKKRTLNLQKRIEKICDN